MFLLQMAGYPGSGKSTLAAEISKTMDAIIIDVDTIKTAMMESGVDSKQIANAAYHTMFSLSEYYLTQNRSVIIDSPCRYAVTLETGMSIANKYNVKYKFIECRLNDFNKTNERLKTRMNKPSQFTSTSEEDFNSWLEKSQRPMAMDYLTVDTSEPISSYIQEILIYVNS